MGNTCASVHIGCRGNLDRVTQAIIRAYGKIGYERVKKAPPEGSKHVILRAGAGQSYVSVYDSDNAKLDNGELKDLALAVSKALKTVAVFTSLYDSDTYEFIVFASGRQVDLLMTDAESYAGPGKRLSDKSRAAKWSTLFRRTITADQIARASTAQTVFADHVIARLSDLIGLSHGQPQINYEDLIGGGEEITAQLYFNRKPMAVPDIPVGEIRLANAFDPDDTRMFLVYPASWPIPVGKPTNVRWMFLSQGAGFNGGTATVRLSGPEGPVFSKGAMRGFKFHNGQFLNHLTPGKEYAKQMAKTPTVMRGRPFAEEAYRNTLHVFKWITNHADCYEYLKTSAGDMAQQIDRFAAENAPLQAWNGQCTWVPLFDQAASGRFTLYENMSVFNWFRGAVEGGGLHRKMMSAQWCSNVLRMLMPQMWLCRNLMDQVNRTALEHVAQVTETNGTYRIALRSGRGLDELALALLPILPIESARIAMR